MKNTKKIFALLLTAVILVCCGCQGASKKKPEDKAPESGKDDGTLRILTIGNSFSDDSMEYVYQIAKSVGVEKISLGNLYIAGCPLDKHYANSKTDAPVYQFRRNQNGFWVTKKNAKLSVGVKAEDWDYISFQQQSGNSGVPQSYSNLTNLTNYVREKQKDSEFVWNMTWAYQNGYERAEFLVNYESDQLKMFSAITSTVQSTVLQNKEFKKVIPTGTAIQNARSSYLGDTLSRDGLHLTKDLGRYIAGLTFVKVLTGKSIDNIEFAPEGVDEMMKKVAIESVNNAVNNPYEITVSAYQ